MILEYFSRRESLRKYKKNLRFFEFVIKKDVIKSYFVEFLGG